MARNTRYLLFAALLVISGLTGYADQPADTDGWVDVSHSLGFPLGGIGTGYSAFGKYGFVKVNFDDRPTDALGKGKWEYLQEPPVKSSFGFVLTDGDNRYVLQTTPAEWTDAKPVKKVTAAAFLPKARAVFSDPELDYSVSVQAWTPLIAYDLDTSTIPIQLFDITVQNNSSAPRSVTLELASGQAGTAEENRVLFTTETGQLAFAADDGTAGEKNVAVKLYMAPQDEATARFYIAWHYPKIDWSKRYYTLAYKDAAAVLDTAKKNADGWRQKIETWHNSIQVPAFLKRIWFGSLSSVMTSTIMTVDPYFYEIETPHPSLNTMDVCIYSNWLYMVNWPELEKMDMSQYFKSMHTEGPKAGLVWHSLWEDAAAYVEEPCFLARLYRDHLWYNDPEWTRIGFAHAVRAANRVYKLDNYEYLVNSKHGNQSYDIWKMPGVSAYVNSSWLYGLYGLEQMARSLDEGPVTVADIPLAELRQKAAASYDKLLWNEKTQSWNCFFRTPGAKELSTPESVFSDQLFGKWVLAIDPGAEQVLPGEKVTTALQTIYTHNLVEDPTQNFRGWCNGMLPGRVPDTSTGYHAKVFWFGPQINLASLLAVDGNEKASLDVMRSVESSLNNNHLAAGEWNRSIDDQMNVIPLREETEKDTPRFAPYPRYKSSWEYLPRILGLQMDEKKLYLKPFKTIDFSLEKVELAGATLTVKVESGWTRAVVDGKEAKLPVALDRKTREHRVEYLK